MLALFWVLQVILGLSHLTMKQNFDALQTISPGIIVFSRSFTCLSRSSPLSFLVLLQYDTWTHVACLGRPCDNPILSMGFFIRAYFTPSFQ